MKNIGKTVILSGVIASFGMLVNVLNVNAMRRGRKTGESYKTEESYSQTSDAEHQRQKINKYLEGYDFRAGQAIKLFPDERWTKEELKFFLKSRCDAVRLLDSQGIPQATCFTRKTTMYKFIDENIGYFVDKLRLSTIMEKLICEDRHLSSEELTQVVNRIKEGLPEEDFAAERLSDEDKWEYIERHYRQAHRILFEEDTQLGIPKRTYSQTRYAEWKRQKVSEYLEGYDFREGQAIQLFPYGKWRYEELEFFLKTRCGALELLESQRITDQYLRFKQKATIYKFIDENIDYFREMFARPSIMKDLIESGVHIRSDHLTDVVNMIKEELNEDNLANMMWTDADKWRYLEAHYKQARRIFFGA